MPAQTPIKERTITKQSVYRKGMSGLVGSVVLLSILAAPATGYPRPGISERVSVGSDGIEGDADSYDPAISADGRYVAFPSESSNLVPGDSNGDTDVFVHDRGTKTTDRVSVGPAGVQANDASYDPAISADGRYVAFRSSASNLVPGDTNGAMDVFVHDRVGGTTERISVDSQGRQAGSFSYAPAISADGSRVAFQSTASNLVPGDTNANMDVFVHDRATGMTERVSVASDGAEADADSASPALSGDGRFIAFRSTASNLVPADSNGILSGTYGFYYDVFVHDRATGTTERVSVASDGAEANGTSFDPAISADGRHVAFPSVASNLVPGDSNVAYDVFVHDRATGTTERVSVASDGTEGAARSTLASISGDGRHVAFYSDASNLVPEDTSEVTDVFVHDRVTGSTQRVSAGSDGSDAEAPSYDPVISADGGHVVFRSTSSNLVPGDTNGVYDVFVHERGSSLDVVGAPSVRRLPEGVEVAGQATLSGAIITEATDLGDDGPAAGAELTRAALIYRPEQEDLLLRLDLETLPPAAGSLPGVLYGLGVLVEETRYEVRALRGGATSTSPRPAHAALYRCAPDCVEHSPLTGSFGATGEQVLVSVPLSALGAEAATKLTGLRAFTAAGESAPGALLALDEVLLPPSSIPASRVELGIAPSSKPAGEVAFTVQASPVQGLFSGTIPTAGIPSGSYRAWARTCLGDVCGPATFGSVSL